MSVVGTGVFKCPLCYKEDRDGGKCYGRNGRYHEKWPMEEVMEEQEELTVDDIINTPRIQDPDEHYDLDDMDSCEPHKPPILTQLEEDGELVALVTAVFAYGFRRKYKPPPPELMPIVALLEIVGQEAVSEIAAENIKHLLMVSNPEEDGSHLGEIVTWMGWYQLKKMMEEGGRELVDKMMAQSMDFVSDIMKKMKGRS